MAKHLTQHQRYYICLQIASGISQSRIAKVLKVNKSTISRELRRNSRGVSDYDSSHAAKIAWHRRSLASSGKAFRRVTKRMLRYIRDKLNEGWSPEVISGRMKIDLGAQISHVKVYRYIQRDKQNNGELFKQLPYQGKKYNYGTTGCSQIIDRVGIEHRPKIVDKKSRIGDFEIDTVVSARNTGKSCLLTMVDRRSKVTFIRKSPDKTAKQIQQALEDIYLSTTLPIITLTSDNGTEFANHKEISNSIACRFYFARPYCSSDRGLNEHTNGLIRRYLPKGTNFDTISNDTIRQIENTLNNRPRKALKYKTPNEVINKYLQRIDHNLAKRKNQTVAFHV